MDDDGETDDGRKSDGDDSDDSDGGYSSGAADGQGGTLAVFCVECEWSHDTGEVLMFGRSTEAFDARGLPKGPFAGTCLRIAGVKRVSYAVPRGRLGDDSGGTTKLYEDLCAELSATCAGLGDIGVRVAKKNSVAWRGEGELPSGKSEFAELTTSFGMPPPPQIKTGTTFSAIACTTMDAVETLLVSRGIKGPCWLSVRSSEDVTAAKVRASSCAREYLVASPASVYSIDPQRAPPPPPLAIFEIDTRTGTDGRLTSASFRSRTGALAPKFAGTAPAAVTSVVVGATTASTTAVTMKSGEPPLTIAREGAASESAAVSRVAAEFARAAPDVVVGPRASESLALLRSRARDVAPADAGAFTKIAPPAPAVGRKRAVPDWNRYSAAVAGSPSAKSACRDVGGNPKSRPGPAAQPQPPPKPVKRPTEADEKRSCGFVRFDSESVVADLSRKHLKSCGTVHVASELLGIDVASAFGTDIDDPGCPSESPETESNSGAAAVEVCWRALSALGAIALTARIANFSGCTWSAAAEGRHSAIVDYMLMHEFDEANFVLPDRPRFRGRRRREDGTDEEGRDEGGPGRRRKAKYVGGLVLEPSIGLHDDRGSLAMLDFRSLYPSIIVEYDICHVHPAGVALPLPGGKPTGIVPGLVARLVAQRDAAKAVVAAAEPGDARDAANIEQEALKKLANMTYGCFGLPEARFSDERIATLICSRGREALTRAAALVRMRGFEVLYGDTDSLMVATRRGTAGDAGCVASALVDEINRGYAFMRIVHERSFPAALITARKKWAYVTPTGAVEYKGVDVVRRNLCDLARDAGRRTCEALLGTRDRKAAAAAVAEHLRTIAALDARTVPLDRLAVSTRLGTAVDAASKLPTTTPGAHVRAALAASARRGRPLRAGEFVTHVACTARDARWPGAPGTAEEPREIARSGGKLVPDLAWYVSEQVATFVARLCATVPEAFGDDPSAFVRDCLGIVVSASVQRSRGPSSSSCTRGAESSRRPHIDSDIVTSIAARDATDGLAFAPSRTGSAVGYWGVAGAPIYRLTVERLSSACAPIRVTCPGCGGGSGFDIAGLWRRTASGAARKEAFACPACGRVPPPESVLAAVSDRLASVAELGASKRIAAEMHARSLFDAEWVDARSGLATDLAASDGEVSALVNSVGTRLRELSLNVKKKTQ